MLYEWRVYHIVPGKLENIKRRFAGHTLGLFKKHGIKVVDFFEDADGDERLYYLCEFTDRAARDTAFGRFRVDPDWVAARDASIKDGEIVAKVESFFMTRVPFFAK